MPVPKLVLSLLLALVGALTPAGSPAHAADGLAIEAPDLWFRGTVALYTTATTVPLRIDRGYLTTPPPGPDGPENLSWDVQMVRTDMRTATPPAWRTIRTRTTIRKHVIAVASGQVICVRARQHSWNLTSAWSRIRCVVRALDDQVLRRVGRVRVVKDTRYADGRASILPLGTRAYIGGVPADALYGPVYTHVGPGLTHCVTPSWRIRGHREPLGARGLSEGWVTVLFHHTKVAGTAVLWADTPQVCPVGGFVVVPRWVRRWVPQ